MKKGDCVLIKEGDEKFCLILHHSLTEERQTTYGFVLMGEIFKKNPRKKEIEALGILGYKYLDGKTDFINSVMKNSQKYDPSVFYTGIKYDVIIIPQEFFEKNRKEIEYITNLELNADFFPMPNFYSRQNGYEQICKLMRERILKRGKRTINRNTIYDSYPLKEILLK